MLTIKRVPIDQLFFDPNNARTHDEKNIASIKGSLVKFGQQKPIVVDGKGIILAGNGTLQAAKELGWREIDIVESELHGFEAMAYALADNRTSELAAWNQPMLKASLLQLQAVELDTVSLGFDLVEPEPEPNNLQGDPDEIPDEAPLRVTRGEIWALGKHRLMCGDSTAEADVGRLLGEARPNLMVTDPPYGVSLDQSWREEALGDKLLAKTNANVIMGDDRADWLDAYKLFPGNIAYVWHASRFAHIVHGNLEACDFEVRQMIVWNKSIMVMGRSAYHWKHEPCWYAVRKGKDANWRGDRKQTTVWDAPPPKHIMSGSTDDKTNHPSQKPIAICEIPIGNHTDHGDGVYDPFCGSGSTIVAAEKLGRACFAMEIDPKYCDTIITRWEKLTGLLAEKLP